MLPLLPKSISTRPLSPPGNSERHTGVNAALASFTARLLAALPADTLAPLRDPIHGTSLLTARMIDAHLTARYGILSPSDLDLNSSFLDIPYQTHMAASAYTAIHLEAHAVAARNNQPFNEATKVKALLTGIATCGLYSMQTSVWKITNPTVVAQTFQLLSADFHDWYNNLGRATTSGSLQYASAVSPADVQAIVAAALAAAALAPPPPVQHVKPRNRPAAPAPGGPPGPYCWTHGSIGHSGHQCKHPAAGHQRTATALNKMGGKA